MRLAGASWRTTALPHADDDGTVDAFPSLSLDSSFGVVDNSATRGRGLGTDARFLGDERKTTTSMSESSPTSDSTVELLFEDNEEGARRFAAGLTAGATERTALTGSRIGPESSSLDDISPELLLVETTGRAALRVEVGLAGATGRWSSRAGREIP